MVVASKIPVVEGGPAGSGVFEATISAAPERLGGEALGNIGIEPFLMIFRRTGTPGTPSRSCLVRSPGIRSPFPGAGELEAMT